MTTSVAEREIHRAAFEALEKARPNVPLAELRREALARFLETGFPTTRHEDWRATNVAPIGRIPFTLASLATSRPDVGFDRLVRGSLPGWRVTFVNGRVDRELSRLSGLPAGVTVTTLAEALEDDGELVRAHLARHASWRDHAFTALNTAFLEEGVVIRLRRGAVLEDPVHALFITASGEEPLAAHPRILVVAEEASQGAVVETHAGSGRTFSNAVTELVLGEGAILRHARVQREGPEAFHVGTVQARQSRASVLHSEALVFGGQLGRHEVNVTLAGEGAECRLDGLYLGHGSQHQDCRTFVDHASPRATSTQLYKGILADSARGVFNGRVLVRRDAQKTDARQGNHALILSESAHADTKPQLEIHADDVKCSHGATIGQLDEDAVFYLRTRGMAEGSARALLTHAFADEIVQRLEPLALRADVAELLSGVLPEASPWEAWT